ncbi:MAG: hypothetical protein ABSC56_02700 [Solirubrobacteraceae bacterium]|jgi:hypothetical protein
MHETLEQGEANSERESEFPDRDERADAAAFSARVRTQAALVRESLMRCPPPGEQP